jgi:Uma2 family endonuclease
MSTHTPITKADFEAFLARPENQGRLFELIDGEIVEKMPTVEHGYIALNIGFAFKTYLLQHPIGIATVESHHQIPEDILNSYIPDVSVILGTEKPFTRKGAAPYMPDIAVEIKSPDDSLKQLRDKAHYYLAHGAQIVWIVLPAQSIVEVYMTDDEMVVGIEEILTGGEVLPGFKLDVKAIFER